MNISRVALLICTCVAMVGCSTGTSTTVSTEGEKSKEPKFADILLTDEESGRTPKTTFTKNTAKLLAYYTPVNMPVGSKLKGAWYCEKSPAVTGTNIKIDEAVVDLPANYTNASFSVSKPTNGWPEGEYRLDLSYNEKVLDSVKFTVSGD